MELNDFLGKLWEDYLGNTPSALKINSLLQNKSETIVNDHIAFRTFKGPFGLEYFEDEFKAWGYSKHGEYEFTEKKLKAIHLEKEGGHPKIFISELLIDKLSVELSSVFNGLNKKISSKQSLIELLKRQVYWDRNFSIYKQVEEESEYAAWVYAHGFRANHFTVNVNKLEKYNDLEKLNNFLIENGFILNKFGGEIKGSKEVFLEQSSTIADRKIVEFMDGKFEIPTCYYEFAKRYAQKDGKLFQGFVTNSADKIFKSTNQGK